MKQLLKKMSAKDGAMTPGSRSACSAHGACSREEPQPKFLRASRIVRALVARLVEHEVRVSGVACPCPARRVEVAPGVEQVRPKPVRLIDFRNCFGMIASVSTLARSSGATRPFRTVNFSMPSSSSVTSTKCPAIAAAAAIAGLTRCVRPPAPCRPSKLRFEVEAQRSPGLEAVVVHAEAHRAARLAPLEAGVAEHLVEAFLLGLRLHQARARHHHRELDVRARRACPCTTAAAARRSSMRELVHEPMKTLSSVMSVIGVFGLRPM